MASHAQVNPDINKASVLVGRNAVKGIDDVKAGNTYYRLANRSGQRGKMATLTSVPVTVRKIEKESGATSCRATLQHGDETEDKHEYVLENVEVNGKHAVKLFRGSGLVPSGFLFEDASPHNNVAKRGGRRVTRAKSQKRSKTHKRRSTR